MKCRDTYLSEHPVCERCAKHGIITAAEHVHHKRELTARNYKNPMIAFNPVEPGKCADIVVFDENINIYTTIVGGSIVFSNLKQL